MGAATIVIGAFLPWAEVTAPLVGTISRSGIDWTSDAAVNALIGALSFAVGVLASGGLRFWGRLVTVVLALGVLAPTAFHASDITDRVNCAEAQSDMIVAPVGIGIYLSFGGVAALIVGAASVPRRPKH